MQLSRLTFLAIILLIILCPQTDSAQGITQKTDSFTISIISPADGATIDRNQVMVAGKVVSMSPEFIVEVNGVLAEIHENTFVAMGIPLKKGANVITAKVSGPTGQGKSIKITVNTNLAYDYPIELDSNIQSGSAPLEITFYIKYSYPGGPGRINSAAMDWEGDGINDYFLKSVECTHTYNAEGLFFPITTLTDDLGNTYKVQTCINVYAAPPLEQIWNAMTVKLGQGDIEEALGYFCISSRDKYRDIFTRLKDRLADMARRMGEIERIYIEVNIAEYMLKKDEQIKGETRTISYPLYFSKDAYGNWCIESF